MMDVRKRTSPLASRRPPRVHVITMGCAKNLVDSERLMGQLRRAGIEMTPTPDGADIAVINTCGFIDAAREESIDMIIDTVRRKSGGSLKKVIAMGCLTERYRGDILASIPELDAVFGANDLPGIVRSIGADYRHELLGERVLTTPSHFAYVKISEGCDRPCSFCAIPLMRGKHAGRSIEEIVAEVYGLAELGVRELIVIGQDTTYYGLDTYGRRRLPELLGAIADVPGIEWVRLMYAYPAQFPHGVLDIIADHPRVCKYLDMPVQHIADPVLRSMRRGITAHGIRSLIDTIRTRIPGIALRTTLITGYPAETEKEFAALMEFVRETEFDRLGVFTYSQEEGTAAFALGDPVPREEKERRKAAIMSLQQEISLRRNEALVGSVQRVLIDRSGDGAYAGRTSRDAPEIDNEVTVTSPRPLAPGTFVDVEIVDALEYDIAGEVVDLPTSPRPS